MKIRVIQAVNPLAACQIWPVNLPHTTKNIQATKLASSLFSGNVGFWTWHINPYARHLLKSQSSTRLNRNMWSVAAYNTLANLLLVKAISALYGTISLGGRVIFIGDAQTYSGAQLQRANYLLNEGLGGLVNLQYGNIVYHHHKWSVDTLAKAQKPYFDLAVVCTESVQHLHYGVFASIAHLTMGTTDLFTRPDFFTYPLPPLGGPDRAAQFLLDVSVAAYLSRDF